MNNEEERGTDDGMRMGTMLLGGVGLGALLMYALDPERGARRRAWVRDKTVRAAHGLGDAAETTARDLGNRARGLAHEAKTALKHEEVADEVLVARVRSEIGRVVSHPGSVQVSATEGRVTLSGPVLKHEVGPVLHCARKVRGVKDVEDRLDVRDSRDNVPGLQGSGRTGRRAEVLQQNWAPAIRFAMGTLGAGLLLRAITNQPTKQMIGMPGNRRGVDFRKAIEVHAPIGQVFAFWRRFDNFPRFMEHVHEVRTIDDRRSHWVVAGPAGTKFEWDAEITQLDENRVIAWKTLPGAAVEHAGVVRFEQTPAGHTRLHVQMSYNPPAGALGHAVASLFRKDPKHAMDDDLIRFKSLIDTGSATAHHHKVRRDELEGAPRRPGQ